MNQTLPADLIRPIVRDVKLIEACVRLWEARFTHVRREADFVLVSDLRQILRKSVPAPDKLEVHSSLLERKALEGSPEASDYLVISAAIWVGRDRLQLLSLDNLAAASAGLNRIIVEIRSVTQVAL